MLNPASVHFHSPSRHRLIPALLLAISLPAFAAQGIPRWELVLNEVLDRAQQEQQSSHDLDPPAPPELAPRPALHPLVQTFVRYFQGPGAPHFQNSLSRLRDYRTVIARVLQEEGLPAGLIWVGLVESGFDPQARSPRNALGIWQLLPHTASAFQLASAPRDERKDPEKSTRAAARYLKHLYHRFGDWPLALAAYNAGEARVQKALLHTRDRDFFLLAAANLLPRETQAYVPAVLAAQFLAAGSTVDNGLTIYGGSTLRSRNVARAPFTLSP